MVRIPMKQEALIKVESTKNKKEFQMPPLAQELAESFDGFKENSDFKTIIKPINLESFSRQKALYDYQIEALKNTLSILIAYQKGFLNDKKRFFKEYKKKILNKLDNIKECEKFIKSKLDIKIKDNGILSEFYESNNGILSFENFINQVSLWMATGSGKTILIIKLIEILCELMKNETIEKKEILFFTANDDLLQAFINEVSWYNDNNNKCYIELKDLKEYETIGALQGTQGYEQTIRVFYTKTPLLKDFGNGRNKDNQINFRNLLIDRKIGDFYVILDEAHKGDKESSLSQNIFYILSQRGFLFNFSATFGDNRNIITTAFNLNQAEFISRGYGKHIFSANLPAFKNKLKKGEEADIEEIYLNKYDKKLELLKALICLAIAKTQKQDLPSDAYAEPLMVVFAKSVNTIQSDLEVFFKLLSEILESENACSDIFLEAKKKLDKEFEKDNVITYECGGFANFNKIKEILGALDFNKLKQLIFYATSGEIVAKINKNSEKEILFALKNAVGEKPFMLLKIGDISPWKNKKLENIQIIESFSEESEFLKLNKSSVNILMGSMSFYEGWDTPRPSVMCFLNIGSDNAYKFVTQSLGRGMRVISLDGKRIRLDKLENKQGLESSQVASLETLFVFATNKAGINAIMDTQKEIQKQQKINNKWEEVELELSQEAKDNNTRILLIPKYKEIKTSLKDLNTDSNKGFKIEIGKKDKDIMESYLKAMQDNKALFALRHNIHSLKQINNFLETSSKDSAFITPNNIDYNGNINKIVEKIQNKIQNSKISKLKGFEKKQIKEQNYILHFKKIRVLSGNENFISKAQPPLTYYKDLENHLYTPLLIHKDSINKLEWIQSQSLITNESEWEFIDSLKAIASKISEKYEWWYFSRIVANIDENVYIPYYSDASLHRFYPDFIFWLQEKDGQRIIFIDPKGDKHTSYENKADEFERIFKGKDFSHFGVKSVELYFTNENYGGGKEYKHLWVAPSNLKKIFL